MKFRKMGLVCILCSIAVVIAVVVLLDFFCRAVELHHAVELPALEAIENRMRDDIYQTFRERKVFQLIEGDVLALEQWLARKYDERVARGESCRSFLDWLGWAEYVIKKGSSGEFRLVDSWGQRLVYRCPHDNPALVCQLYSIGANGIDEGGKGDDIDRSLAYKTISFWFEDPDFDGNTYRRFRGRLTEVTINGRSVIRHP